MHRAHGLGRSGTGSERAVDRAEYIACIAVGDRRQRADDRGGARGQEPAAEAEGVGLRPGRGVERLACRQHDHPAAEQGRSLGGDALPGHALVAEQQRRVAGTLLTSGVTGEMHDVRASRRVEERRERGRVAG